MMHWIDLKRGMPDLSRISLNKKNRIHPSSDKSVNGVARENVRLNAKSLVANSDIISSVIKENDVKIITAFYNMESGVVDFNI